MNFPNLRAVFVGVIARFPSLLAKGEVSAYTTTKSLPSKAVDLINVEPCSVVALAQEALLASREAMSLAADSKLLGAFFDESPQPMSVPDELHYCNCFGI